MTALLTPGMTSSAAAAAEAELDGLEPGLVAGLRRELPRAMDVVARRLVSAAYREGLSRDVVTWVDGKATLPRASGGVQVAPASLYAFDRLEFDDPLAGDPAELLKRLVPGGADPLREELADASVNLALALTRRSEMERDLVAQARASGAADLIDLWAGIDPDERGVNYERLATEGHNLHPCARTRLGWACRRRARATTSSRRASTVGFVGSPPWTPRRRRDRPGARSAGIRLDPDSIRGDARCTVAAAAPARRPVRRPRRRR